MSITERKCIIYEYFIIKKIRLDKCMLLNYSKIYLYFKEREIENFIFTNVKIKNIKTREEYDCPFIIKKPNLLIVDFSELLYLFTDYEASIKIICKNNETIYELIPLLINSDICIKNNININRELTCFTRILENGEIRLSAILNHNHP